MIGPSLRRHVRQHFGFDTQRGNMRHFLLFLTALIALPLHLAAQADLPATAVWPRELQQRYDEAKAECRQAGGKFVGSSENFAQQVEVTNDGRPDWVIEHAATRCTAFGYSASCGTAGCSIEILGSTRSGLATIYNTNVRDWEVVDAGNGRKGLLLSMHGSVCDTYGAEVCRVALVWNGRKWDMVSKRTGFTAAEQRAFDAEIAALTAPQGHTARWFFAGQGTDAVAAVTDHPSFVAVGIRCAPGGGLLLSVMPRPDFALPAPGQNLLLSFTGSVVELEWTQPLRPAAGTQDFNEILPDPLRDLLAGRDDMLGLLASVDGGDEWQELDDLSLSGSSTAIRSLQRECASLAQPEPIPTGARTNGPNSAAVTTVPPLGIAAGYYVDEGTSCTDPIDAFYYDGRKAGVIYSEGGFAPDPIGKVTKKSGEYFLPNAAILVKVLGTTRVQLTIQDTDGPSRLCPTEQIPQSIRRLVR
ncbi:MAG: hypothetical protein U1D66_06885 [Erythrobacter sp.]|nr:hypothetical protein [Erythrobacter sp.]